MHIRSYSKAQKGHGVRNEPQKAVLDALYQAACIEDLILVSTMPEAMSTKSVLTRIILHVPRTVHLPLHPSEAAQLYPLLDKLTSSITRCASGRTLPLTVDVICVNMCEL
ncbi:hypothetical protein CEUSTIGMA_g9380.t1 [Chlamydomonas eustigma]|uniref:Uncharacterized protein n=1 Tax=Chlamydomonas eustigma TaxID=1157962 RepID=A0A250XGA7_9CHLO|nr:hypothetical protein CEUSTIGMA_g9380.t1 [Chlamydomonas eustigma]|eukprot:GAX81952.1 hypothetical protein CEUSTIGMA_g9380.t1 [Chlamydomonas eustigma]